MKRSLAVLCSVGLTLGLLMALGGSAWAQTCPNPPADLGIVNFGGVLVGNASNLSGFTFAVPLHATIIGPNAIEFAVAGNTCDAPMVTGSCQVNVRFIPLGCGVRTATLVLTANAAITDYPAGCPVATATLVGFGCSINCAIDATQAAIATGLFSTTGGNAILRELILAQATTGAVRCFHLNCALCLASGRAGATAVIDQITCLLVALCSPTPPSGV